MRRSEQDRETGSFDRCPMCESVDLPGVVVTVIPLVQDRTEATTKFGKMMSTNCLRLQLESKLQTLSQSSAPETSVLAWAPRQSIPLPPVPSSCRFCYKRFWKQLQIPPNQPSAIRPPSDYLLSTRLYSLPSGDWVRSLVSKHPNEMSTRNWIVTPDASSPFTVELAFSTKQLPKSPIRNVEIVLILLATRISLYCQVVQEGQPYGNPA